MGLRVILVCILEPLRRMWIALRAWWWHLPGGQGREFPPDVREYIARDGLETLSCGLLIYEGSGLLLCGMGLGLIFGVRPKQRATG